MLAKRQSIVAVAVAVVLTLSACKGSDKPAETAPAAAPATAESASAAPATQRVVGPLSPEDAAALATMNDRVREYLAIHTKIEASLPKLPENATPQQIDKNQRSFENLMRKTRATAKQGDIFTPQAQPVIKKLMANIFGGDEGKQLKLSIMDENPTNVKLTVNGRYPDTVPLSTIPPQILQTLPKLTEDLEYRFVGNDLILLDTHAHTIADFIPNAFPTY
jgi:hypothetical protein